VCQLAAAAARTTSTVLITGESGTGTEEIARHLHRLGGRGPFVAVNCGAIPEALAESELFGHERGAFTGAVAAREGRIESADGGTLFLDEVGELSPALQVKLLRVLQERVFQRVGSSTPRSVNLRVVAATHRRLEAEVAAGRFRDDLYYRLNVVRIEIPPLRDRREDIGPLAVALLGRVAARLGCADPGLEPAAREALAGAAWPGNARELANVLERVLVLRDPAARGPLRRDEIAGAMGEVGAPAPAPTPPPATPAPTGGSPGSSPGVSPGASPGQAGLTDKVAALERAEILAALRAARGVKARAAKQLGISRPTLDKKMTDLGIDLWSEGNGDGA
jgi:DNA-binding NtrC family response regulator